MKNKTVWFERIPLDTERQKIETALVEGKQVKVKQVIFEFKSKHYAFFAPDLHTKHHKNQNINVK